MLAGLSGTLLSSAFLERTCAAVDHDDAANALALHRRVAAWRRRSADLGPASSPRALLERGAAPFLALLGFSAFAPTAVLKNAAATVVHAAGDRVAVVVTAWGDPLDGAWRAGVEHSARTRARWCVCFNGTHVRLIDARQLYAKRHIEFDIDMVADDPDTCRALAAVMAAASLEARGLQPCTLEALIAASERFAADVCRSLQTGVLDASTAIFGALNSRRGRRDRRDAFEQSVTIVYRILFLLFAEARQLVPLWHPLYRGSYSMETLCDLAARGRVTGLWDTIRAVSRLAHAGCRIGDLNVTPFNGRLFAPSRTPLVDCRALDDAAAARALVALSTQPSHDRQGRERVAYRDLGVEQLGGVYESLLDYEPCDDGTLAPGSGERKATGTFYTPRGVAEYLVRRTLGPLVHDASPERILELKVLDPAMGSGAFLVAACSYLARAYETALIQRGGCLPLDFGPPERAAIRRTIAERCLFGVDVNPMAVQLARLSIWLATLAADRPLSFLDHHLVCGDSTVGAWLSSMTRAPVALKRARPEPALPLFDVEALTSALQNAVPVRFLLATQPNDTPAQVREKEHTLAALSRPGSPLARWKLLANVWCAQWFAPAAALPRTAFAAMSDWVLRDERALPVQQARACADAAEEAAVRFAFLHWELEFPEVFFDAHGRRREAAGFDAVLGNPPWEMIRGDTGTAGHRQAARDAGGALVRFTRESGTYTSQSDGHANRYQLFVERSLRLLRAGGRMGLVVPSGLSTDHGSAPLRRLLFSRCAIDGIVGFDNAARIFPIHRSVRFQLLTATTGEPTREIPCRLGERDPAILDSAPELAGHDWFPVRISPALLERLTGDDLALPDFRREVDVRIAERASTLFAPLADPQGWGARFGRELNATEDRGELRARERRGFPVVEGKMLSPFCVDQSAATLSITAAAARRLFGERCFSPRLAYRDVASATNRVTLIAAVLPAQTASTHTVFCLRTPVAARHQHFLCGMFNSLVVNYLARLRVTTHVTTAIVERLPIPAPRDLPAGVREIAAIARVLARRNDPRLFARLNARVARMYQLTREEFAHVLGTFPLVPAADRDAALREFERAPRTE